MTTIAQVREGLAAAASVAGTRVSPYLSDIKNVPCGMVSRPPFDPRLVFGGAKSSYVFRISYWFPRTTEVVTQQRIDELCDQTGSQSFTVAVQTSANWAVDIDYAQVVLIGETVIELFPAANTVGAEYIRIDFDVEVVW